MPHVGATWPEEAEAHGISTEEAEVEAGALLASSWIPLH